MDTVGLQPDPAAFLGIYVVLTLVVIFLLPEDLQAVPGHLQAGQLLNIPLGISHQNAGAAVGGAMLLFVACGKFAIVSCVFTYLMPVSSLRGIFNDEETSFVGFITVSCPHCLP